MSARLKLTLSYAAFLMIAGILMLAAVWLFVLRYIPAEVVYHLHPSWWFRTRSDPLNGFASVAVFVLGFLLLFGLLGGWLLAGRMLAPLDRITAATRLAGDGSLSHRIHLEGPTDEFRELADAFDAMLARLEAHVAEQQRFAANASHELRTPLAITQTLLEVAQKDPDRDTDALLERLDAVNARAIGVTEAMLLLSRADQRSFTREPVDLSLIAEEAVEVLLPLAERRGVTIETSGEPAPTDGSHALLLQMATNLIHNAVVHNVAEGGTVQVSSSAGPESVTLTVENTGETLTPELVATLAEPFRRGTDRIRADHAGVGLGLAIVKSILEAHDGTLTLAPQAGGGLRVSADLPASTPPKGGLAREPGREEGSTPSELRSGPERADRRGDDAIGESERRRAGVKDHPGDEPVREPVPKPGQMRGGR